MRKALKWIGVIFGSFLLLVIVVAGAIFLRGKHKLEQTYEVTAPAVAVPAGPEAVARGEHVMSIHACRECHGPDLGGGVFLDIPPGLIVATNLTAGEGGIGDRYGDADWDHAIRYGVDPDGRWLLPFMPYDVYHFIGDEDMGALIAYLKSLPPVDNELPESRLRLPGYLMAGIAGLDRHVRTASERPPTPPRGPTAAYGAYIASSICVGCHGGDLRGGPHPAPGAPPGPDLAGAGVWPFEDFARAVREGIGPGGRPLDPAMPSAYFTDMTDEELRALQARFEEILQAQSAGTTAVP